MTNIENKNDFLLELLALQQDGKHAISAPTNWTKHPPILSVPTEVDEIISDLSTSILLNNDKNDTARWHFFIGSPGNGKSAAMGKLCRQLIEGKTCQIRDENNIAIPELEATAIPYAINIFEGSNSFSSAQIVQDASVVRTPFSSNVDPAAELLQTLEKSWDKGISLIVCTNRGVLEKAHRDYHADNKINTRPWFKILAAVVQAEPSLKGQLGSVREFEEKRTVFRRLQIGYSHLDNRSLLLGRNTFEQLLLKATSEENWKSCGSCAAQEMCPFKTNREWLLDQEARKKVLQLLTRAEILSGQVIVFREALAIISLILAGCPRDYEKEHPCKWVQGKIENSDIFSLASRRIYMSLFASSSPRGLESAENLFKKQFDSLCSLLNFIEPGKESSLAINSIQKAPPPSTDVGVPRLLGVSGIISSLDPCREALPEAFYETWDSEFEAILKIDSPLLTKIELTCINIWKALEDSLELASDHGVARAHWALRRWSSNFLLHLGALLEGRSAWAEELDEFAKLLNLVATPIKDRSIEDKKRIAQLDLRLESLLNAISGGDKSGAVQLSEAVTLSGEWVHDTLKPKVAPSGESGSVSLAIQFAGGERATLAAPMYLWLTRRAGGKLDVRCFPQELLSGAADARVRAAAKGRYAFENNKIELIIDTGKGEKFILTRFDGEVDVTNEQSPLP